MTLTKPPKGQIWIHVDRLDRKDDRVWAVQHWSGRRHRYECVKSVILHGDAYTQFFGPHSNQPKAVISMTGSVKVLDGVAYVN